MTYPIRALEEQDEPALLRDQFRQLLRYRALLASLARVLGPAVQGRPRWAAEGDAAPGRRTAVRTWTYPVAAPSP